MKERGDGKRKGGDSAIGSRLLSKGERKSSFWQVEREEKKDFNQTWRILRRLAKFIKISVKKGYFLKKVPNGALVNYISVKLLTKCSWISSRDAGRLFRGFTEMEECV